MLSFDQIIVAIVPLAQVIMIDLVLAGDNAIVVGMAAAGLPKHMRGKVILIGIAAATVLRIVFALATNQLLAIIGLTLAGGILLLWVCWKFWRELMHERRRRLKAAAMRREALTRDERVELAEHEEALPGAGPAKTMRQAIIQIILADVSMSLDNVLAVAGAAGEHMWVLVVGLLLSVGLMGAAATLIAGLLKRYHWIAYVGLAIILWVAVDMIYRGTNEVVNQMNGAGAAPATSLAAG
ncbi:TerC family protein [Dongia sedimenti]|uniref:TerC family protein n=1 Tax=Dongia sedimenti TaxID=3064282 RepID=A0ABU0YRU7_9PROT|nr:TerC family protein [Rhodospirillaceae bacterium R-7]